MIENDAYNNLREWYLARLRNQARQQAARTAVTPASLIASDKFAIQQLVAESVRMSAAQTARKQIPLQVLPLIWLLVQITVLGSLIISRGAVLKALVDYQQICLNPLVPFVSSGHWFDNVQDRICFALFYWLPILLLVCAPSGLFSSSQLKQEKPDRFASLLQKASSSRGLEMAAQIAATVLVCLACALMIFGSGSENAEGVQALTLVPQQLEPAVATLLSWSSLVVLIFAFIFKVHIARGHEELAGLKRLCVDSKASQEIDTTGCIEQIENVVEELKQKEQAIADYSNTVICSFDRNLIVQAVSPSAFIHWGYAVFELVGQELSGIVFQEDMNAFEEAVKKAVNAQVALEVEIRIRKKDNSILDCLWYIDWSQKLDRFFVAFEDITDRRNLERARRSFIAQLTHDMRSPLASIDLSLSAIQEGVFGEVSEAIVRTVERSQSSLSRVLGLINDILEGEQLRAGRMELQKEVFSARALCDQVLGELAGIAAKREVELLIKGDNYQVKADKKRVARVITNLVSNAISFSPKNSAVRVEIQESGNAVITKVHDSGPGVPKDYQKLIFERFSGPKNAQADRVSTGIGLSICRDIVTAHGGMIGLESEPGKGSVFWFTLPIDRRTTEFTVPAKQDAKPK